MKGKVNYSDDRGEMPDKLFVVSEDILPSPAEFARALEREKVTINLSAGSLSEVPACGEEAPHTLSGAHPGSARSRGHPD